MLVFQLNMHIVQFVHPNFLASQSMPRFAKMISDAMRARGHSVIIWTASPWAYRLPCPKRFKKWLGYIDQYILFPIQVRHRLAGLPPDTLFVFTDQALGPWVSLVANRPNVIHVHDFMALRSALGEFKQNLTGWTGRQYQAFIRRGFALGSAFVSDSKRTFVDLHRFLLKEPRVSTVVYLGLNYSFRCLTPAEYVPKLNGARLNVPRSGFLMHVGGNQWYKNRCGVLEIYIAYVKQVQNPLPLWMVGELPAAELQTMTHRIPAEGEVKFLTNLSDEQVCAAYSAARLMIFPSLSEGFGWPIAEAMACGCLVLTTDEAPMTEVGGEAAFYIPQRPHREAGDWATQAGGYVEHILALPPDKVASRRELGVKQVAQFDAERAINAYEKIYQQVVDASGLAN